MKKFNKVTGEEVNRSDWKWSFEAIHDDGTTIKQFNEDTGVASGFFDIDQSRLSKFKMVNGIHQFTMDFPAGAKLIHFRRTTRLKDSVGRETPIITYGFGYEEDKKVQLYYLIEQMGGHWLLVDTNSKDSMRWISEE